MHSMFCYFVFSFVFCIFILLNCLFILFLFLIFILIFLFYLNFLFSFSFLFLFFYFVAIIVFHMLYLRTSVARKMIVGTVKCQERILFLFWVIGCCYLFVFILLSLLLSSRKSM